MLIDILSDRNYFKKMQFLNKVSKEMIATGKRCRDYPEYTFPEPVEINHQFDYMLALFAMSNLANGDEDENKEREAKRICERMLSDNLIKIMPESFVKIAEQVYVDLMIYCGDSPEKIKAFYQSIGDAVRILPTDNDVTVASKSQTQYAYQKLIIKDETAAEQAKKRCLEATSKLKFESHIADVKKEIERVERLSEKSAVTN
jgi:hypothetical protein